jgi:hypothetical protein
MRGVVGRRELHRKVLVGKFQEKNPLGRCRHGGIILKWFLKKSVAELNGVDMAYKSDNLSSSCEHVINILVV